jgi:DNA polymerase bacteriophage-type
VASVKKLFLDTETRSRVDISLGTDLYTHAAECLIVTYAFESGPAQIWEPWNDPIPPLDLWTVLRDPEYTVIALNTAFDRLILRRALHIEVPVERWRCVMAQGNAHGLPGGLEQLGAVCDLPENLQKLTGDDYKLIDTFCIPQRVTNQFVEPWERPDDWKRFCDYAVRDTESLRAVSLALPTANYTGTNLASWHLDQLVNERGFGFDQALARAAVSFLGDAKVASDAAVFSATDGAVHAATQRDRLLHYIRNKCKVDIDSLKASEVTEWLESDDLEPTVRLLLEERLQAGKSAGSKFATGLQRVGPESRIRHWSRWNGAGRTGRHSGRGYQPHNMARPTRRVRRVNGRIELEPVKADYIDSVILPGIYSKAALNDRAVYGGPNEAVALAVRHAIVAAPGNELMAADFKNIESVITAWIAGEAVQVVAFQDAFDSPKDKSKDVYRILAGKMLGKRPEDVTENERQMGKVCVLAFGFGGGVSALVSMAIAYQMDLDPLPDIVLPTATPEQLFRAERNWRRAFLSGEDFGLEKRVYMACDVLKQQYRTANSAIDQLRKDVDVATKNAIENRGSVYHVGRCTIWAESSMLIIQLPSGRRLLYVAPELKSELVEDPEGGEPWKSSYITYMTFRGKFWQRERAWSGLFVENIVQACANDVLRAAMLRVHADTLTVPAVRDYLMTLPPEARTSISLHVHDEIVLDLPISSYPIDRFKRVITTKEPWMDGLPITADTWSYPRYGKR